MDANNAFSLANETEGKGSKRARSRSIIREFSLNTSTHGIPGIARSESLLNRLFWSFSLLVFIGIMFYFIIASIVVYFNYPTQTSIEVQVQWPQAFPAVTVCNYSPFIYSQFIGPFTNFTNTFNLTNTTETAPFSAKQAIYFRDFVRYILDTENSLQKFAFPLESMLMSCSYNEMPCTAANFTWFSSLRYGMCYTFNAKARNTTNGNIRYSSDNAGDGRLALSFYIHRHQYIPYVTRGERCFEHRIIEMICDFVAAGMMVMVHDNDQFPQIAFSGLQLAPGRNHKLSYTKKTNVFLPAPYTTCTNRMDPAMQMMIDRYQGANYTYTQSICYTTCVQGFVYKACGCVSPSSFINRYVELADTKEVIRAPLCSWTDSCSTRILAEYSQAGSLRDQHCPHCGPECQFNTFLIKASSLAAPMESELTSVKSFVESSNISRSGNWSETWRTDIPANYVSLEVVCETTRTEIYTQQASVSAVDLLSNVGGQTGLWIGISFLSLLEIVEMLYRLGRSRYHRLATTIRERLRRKN